ncbi:hypothetical protein NHQ30_004153 [Ciborinia camelliae]|nr:hypothetical protein NHQ30_004153 [Ciborinia camelliae]
MSSMEKGRVGQYDLVVSNEWIAPDGVPVLGMVFNSQFPGPMIEVSRLGGYFENNGAQQVGESEWYNRPLAWYPPIEQQLAGWSSRSDAMSDYDPAGLYGPLKINGPTSQNYDVDLGPLMISDWFHENPFSLFYAELCCGPLFTTSRLLQGQGVYYNESTGVTSGSYYSLDMVKGTTYKISMMNAGTSTQYTFWIDGHTFTVVSTDFVPIKGYQTDTLNIAVGQRYDIIVKANADTSNGTNFWIHARDCNDPTQNSTIGILRYDSKSKEYPPDLQDNRPNFGCLDPTANDVVPVVSRKVGNPSNQLTPEQYLNASLQPFPRLDPNTRLVKWSLKEYPLSLNWSLPSLKLIQDNKDTTGVSFPKEYVPIFLNYPDNDWLYFLIEGMYNTTDPNVIVINTTHPIHLHGHDFSVLAQSNTPFNASTFSLNLDNPPRRDTAILPQNGYLVIGFEMDNPGAWLLHCHISWHASSGMAVQFVTSAGKLQRMVKKAGIMSGMNKQCDDWASWYDYNNIPSNYTQDSESGI